MQMEPYLVFHTEGGQRVKTPVAKGASERTTWAAPIVLTLGGSALVTASMCLDARPPTCACVKNSTAEGVSKRILTRPGLRFPPLPAAPLYCEVDCDVLRGCHFGLTISLNRTFEPYVAAARLVRMKACILRLLQALQTDATKSWSS